MRWLLEQVLEGSGGPSGPERGPVRLREATTRVRLRSEYHRQRAERAREDFDHAARRVRFLEMSEDAEVPELVEAHQELRRVRHALGHHERRLQATWEVHAMMREDLLRLQDGRDPMHHEAYAPELEG